MTVSHHQIANHSGVKNILNICKYTNPLWNILEIKDFFVFFTFVIPVLLLYFSPYVNSSHLDSQFESLHTTDSNYMTSKRDKTIEKVKRSMVVKHME